VRDLAAALGLLTVVPVPTRMTEKLVVKPAAWFPLVGLFLGACGWTLAVGLQAVSRLGSLPHGAPLTVAALVVASWCLLTRFLHWDGLADVADGAWASSDPSRRLEVMADSHTGAFGATAVALVAIVQVAAASEAIASGRLAVLIAAPVLGRLAATFGAWLGTPARPSGLGASVLGRPRAVDVLVTCVTLAACAFVYAAAGGGWLAPTAGALAAPVLPHLLARRFGGVTGDVLGASVLLTETVVLVVVAVLG